MMWQFLTRASIPRASPTSRASSMSKELARPVAHGKQVDKAPLKTIEWVNY